MKNPLLFQTIYANVFDIKDLAFVFNLLNNKAVIVKDTKEYQYLHNILKQKQVPVGALCGTRIEDPQYKDGYKDVIAMSIKRLIDVEDINEKIYPDNSRDIVTHIICEYPTTGDLFNNHNLRVDRPCIEDDNVLFIETSFIADNLMKKCVTEEGSKFVYYMPYTFQEHFIHMHTRLLRYHNNPKKKN